MHMKKKIVKINVIKIDIEGNELQALKGMTTILREHKPILFIEINKEHLLKFNTTISEVFTFLKNYNYTPYDIDSTNNTIPVKNAKESDIILFISEHCIVE